MFIKAVKVRKAGLREYQETCTGKINETYNEVEEYICRCVDILRMISNTL